MPSMDSSSLQDVKILQAGLVPQQQLDLQAKQIRILRLLPGEWKDDVRCELYTAYLDDKPYYQALSYVWGDPRIHRPILLDGRWVQVTRNLAAALRSLRRPDKPRHMWVDALCIDQTNDVEKSHQVNLMKEIYEQTELALLWLGSLDKRPSYHGMSDTRIGTRDARETFGLIWEMARAGEDDHFEFDGDFGDVGAIQITDESIDALETFLGLSWWKRIWTVQEAVLPHKAVICCGRRALDWSALVRAQRTISQHISRRCCDIGKRVAGENHVLRDFVSRVLGIEACRKPSFPLVEALEIHRFREAGDPRDKLYALLGLKTDWGSKLSKLVDYSLSPGEVYRRMTIELIKGSNNLKPLIRTRDPSTDTDLPTWVHDLSAASDPQTTSIIRRYDFRNASGGKALSVEFGDQRKLKCRGILVDEVEDMGTAYDADDCVELLGNLVYSNPQYVPGLGAHSRPAWGWRDPAGITDMSVVGTVLFITNKGFIGMGPRHMEVGDRIHVLFGGNMPFILRPVIGGEDEGCYTYVGHCYVEGIMDGEAVQNVGEGELFTIV